MRRVVNVVLPVAGWPEIISDGMVLSYCAVVSSCVQLSGIMDWGERGGTYILIL